MKRHVLSTLFLISLLIPSFVKAATFTVAQDGDFFAPATWGNPAGPIPADGDAINIIGDFTVSISNASITLASLLIQGQGKLVATVGSPSITVLGNFQVMNDASVLGIQIQIAGSGSASGGIQVSGFWDIADNGSLSIQDDINIEVAQSMTFYNNQGGSLDFGGQININCGAFADCYIVNVSTFYMNLTGTNIFKNTRIDNYGSLNLSNGNFTVMDGNFRNYAGGNLSLASSSTITLQGGNNELGYPDHVFGGYLSMSGANFVMSNTSASFVSINNLNSFSAYNSSFDIVGYHVSADNVILDGNTILGPGGTFIIQENGVLDNNDWSSLDLQINPNAIVDFESGVFLYGVDIDISGTLNIAHGNFRTEGAVVLSINFNGHIIGNSSNGDNGFDEGVAGLKINNNGEFRKIGAGTFTVEGILESFAGVSVININQGMLLLQNGNLSSTGTFNIKPGAIFFNSNSGVAYLAGTIIASLGKLHTISNTTLDATCTIGIVEVTSGTLQVNQNLTVNLYNQSGGTTTFVTTGNHIGDGTLSGGTVTGVNSSVQVDGVFTTNNGTWNSAQMLVANGATLQQTGTLFSGEMVLNNLGVIDWSQNDWDFTEGSALQNDGIWIVPSFNLSFYTGGSPMSSVVNAGTINKNGNGTVAFIDVPITSEPGSFININKGELLFADGLFNDGNVSISALGTLNLLGGTSNIHGTVNAVSGTILCSGGINTFYVYVNAGKFDLQGGQNNFEENISVATLTIFSPSENVFNGAFNSMVNGTWFGGTLSIGNSPASNKVLNLSGMLTWCTTSVKNGTLGVLTGANINLGINGNCGNGTLDGAQLINHGSVNWVSGNFNMMGGSEIANYAEFNVFAQSPIILNGSSTVEVFRNRGPFSVSGIADVKFINVTLVQETGGSIGISGKLILQSPFQNNAQTVTIGAGAILDICYDNTITGTINSLNGTINVTAGNVQFNLPLAVSAFQAISGETHLSQPLMAQFLEVLANGQLFFAAGTTNAVVNANLTNGGITLGELNDPAILNVTGSSNWQGVTISNGILNNSGAVNFNAGVGVVAATLQGAIFQNTGTVNWNSGDLIFSGIGSTINNSGIFLASSNSSQSMNDMGANSVFNNNAPGIFKHTSVSTLTIEPSFNNNSGATVGGIGTMNFNDFNDVGNVAPGQSPGLLSFSNGFDNTNGILKMEIGGTVPGTDYDQLAVTGNVIMGGNLEVNFINGYNPTAGTFILMTYTGTASGTLPVLSCATPGCVLSNFELQHDEGAKNLKLVLNTAPLPIELISFYARQNDQSVRLTWQTASEINNDYFLIEHSLDGINFSEIGNVNAKGNSHELQTYVYTHQNPYHGINYYRLKQVDFDGKYTYSNIIGVSLESNEINLFPNPTTGMIEIQGINTDDVTVIIKNSMGKLIAVEEMTEGHINLGSLPNGVYFLELLTNGESTLRRIVKQ